MEAFTIDALHARYAGGGRPGDVVAEACARLAAAADPGIFIALLPRERIEAAAAGLGAFDPIAKPLWGVPFAVKDNIDVAGMATTAACPDFSTVAERSAPAVERLLAAGALLVGKTNLDQFATGLVGTRTPYPVPRNAVDPAYVPGGSSSGSAVAVARGIVAFALGTDTAGSGRVPAALNNVVGLKPTLRSVPMAGVVPACRTLDVLSVFALTVADAARAYAVMAGTAGAGASGLPLGPPLGLPFGLPLGLPAGLRIGVPDAASRRFGGDPLAERAFDASLQDIRDLLRGDVGDAPLAAVDFAPLFATAGLLYDGPWVAERYQAIRPMMEHREDALHPTTRAVIARARLFSAADAFAGLYRLDELRARAEAIWRDVDVLAVPTFPRPRRLAEDAADPFGPNAELGTYTNFVNLLDWCALAVPGRRRDDGFPSGVTLIARRGRDGLIAALGARLHALADVPLGITATRSGGTVGDGAPPARAMAGEVEIAVVGAHLGGLALNHELTSRGARLLRAAATLPDYRLYALAGAPPARPGLLRVGRGAGASIAVEVWALEPAAFGAFVAAIPAPLGVGTLALADGTSPKGFLVEAEGVEGSRDISRFGGWRAYLASLAPATAGR